MTDTQKIKDCPFCGENVELNGNEYEGYWISCQCRNLLTNDKESVVVAWNARHNEAPTSKTQELIERIDNAALMKRMTKDYKTAEVLADCKAQLTAQADEIKRLHEGLEDIAGINDVDGNSMACDTHEECQYLAQKLLNNEVK